MDRSLAGRIRWPNLALAALAVAALATLLARPALGPEPLPARVEAPPAPAGLPPAISRREARRHTRQAPPARRPGRPRASRRPGPRPSRRPERPRRTRRPVGPSPGASPAPPAVPIRPSVPVAPPARGEFGFERPGG